MSIQEATQGKVARLLAMVCTDDTDPEAYEFVLARLTRMAILGTLPAGCSPREWSYKTGPVSPDTDTEDDAPEQTDDDDFSAKKERFIAP